MRSSGKRLRGQTYLSWNFSSAIYKLLYICKKINFFELQFCHQLWARFFSIIHTLKPQFLVPVVSPVTIFGVRAFIEVSKLK